MTKRISNKAHGKIFNASAQKTKRKNKTAHYARGGIRL